VRFTLRVFEEFIVSFIHPRNKEVHCKIAYFGPAGAGKTTTLSYLHQKTAPAKRGDVMTLSKSEDKTLFFDFLPLSLGKVGDYTYRIHVYTLPGQVIYDASRTLILKGIDGLIFTIDSQMEKLEENFESWKNLQKSLKNHGVNLRNLPVALQYNKRDLTNRMPVESLRSLFNDRDFPEYETVATTGKNVMECFQDMAKKVLKELKND
jgi:mutual gliding-motility protein MglA